MQRMLFILAMCLVSTLLVLLQAQEVKTIQRPPEQEAAKHTEMLKRHLGLSPEQIDTIYQLNLDFATRRQQASSREEIMELFKTLNLQLKTLLTEEQYNKYKEHQTTCRSKHAVTFKVRRDSLSTQRQ